MKTKKVKGFTLIELIIVLALFTMIMAAALSLLFPIQKVFKNTNENNAANAVVDQVSEAVESKLRYADRLWIYPGYDMSDPDKAEEWANDMAKYYMLCGKTSATEVKWPIEGYDDMFFTRKTASTDTVYVMTFNNELKTDPDTGEYKPRGVIELRTYKLAEDGSASMVLQGDAISSYPNAAYNKEYSFVIHLGQAKYLTNGVDASGETIYIDEEGNNVTNDPSKWVVEEYTPDALMVPEKFRLTFDLYKNVYSSGALTDEPVQLNQRREVVFALQNLYDSSKLPLVDVFEFWDDTTSQLVNTDPNIGPFDANKYSRFKVHDANVDADGNTNEDMTFVFTLPVRIERELFVGS